MYREKLVQFLQDVFGNRSRMEERKAAIEYRQREIDRKLEKKMTSTEACD